jgi:iron-sulfur cluster repair protein YtfE (RIC family)
LPLLEKVREAADAVHEGETVTDAVESAYEFLSGHLLPHAIAEEAALYPVVGRVMGSQEATKTMETDHAEVKRLTEVLGKLRAALPDNRPSAEQARALRRVLYGLYALVRIHFQKEESVYLPLLDSSLTPEEANAMFEEMEEAAERAKQG